jgi:hypothetical protein
MATKEQTVIVTISQMGSGKVLDQIAVYTENVKNTVKLIAAEIEDSHWVDEDDFDAFMKERGSA